MIWGIDLMTFKGRNANEQRAIEILNFHPGNNSKLDWKDEENAYLNYYIKILQEAQCEAVEKVFEYIITNYNGQDTVAHVLKDIRDITPEKVLGEG
mgnify:CR=1 FL=1